MTSFWNFDNFGGGCTLAPSFDPNETDFGYEVHKCMLDQHALKSLHFDIPSYGISTFSTFHLSNWADFFTSASGHHALLWVKISSRLVTFGFLVPKPSDF